MHTVSIVSSFSWDLQWSQEKTKTMLMQNLGGQTKSIIAFSEVAYGWMQEGRNDKKKIFLKNISDNLTSLFSGLNTQNISVINSVY